MKRHTWKVKQLHPIAWHAAAEHGVSIALAQVLLNRGVEQEDFNTFLNPSKENLHSPFLLPDIEKAVVRIKRSVAEREKVLVFGDYDVDGITSLAIFHEFAKRLPDVFSYYIPHRIHEGYGLNSETVARAKEEGVSLIICFDCGSNAKSEINLARSLGIDIIVVDHHQLSAAQIEPYAFINPNRKDAAYPFAALSSAALSFKLLQALTTQSCFEVLDLVALSLVCDVVPLQGENRALLKAGLEILRTSPRPAIKGLCSASGIKQKNIDTFHIGYILGPRINASGRVAHAEDSLRLFLTEDIFEAEKYAGKLSEYNTLRRNIEAQILKEAEQKISETFPDAQSIVVSGESWHPGVLGIVASRLKEKYGRPSFVISFDKEKGVGSGRSIDGLHLIQLLDECADFLLAYGGHKKAAGVHIDKDKLETFKEKINSLIEENASPEDFIPALDIDASLSLSDIDLEFAGQIEMLKPHGEGNAKPLFVTRNLFKKSTPKKVKMGYSVWLSDSHTTFEALFYDKGLLEIINYAQKLDVVYSPQMNTYHNIPRLIIKDCRIAENAN